MAGTHRSGRRKTDGGNVRKTASGKPRKPLTMDSNEEWYWTHVIELAEHLGEIDTAQCKMACELWGLYRKSAERARSDPTDKDARVAVNTYAGKVDQIAARLALDPLGRERITKDRKQEDNPLEEFGIVG